MAVHDSVEFLLSGRTSVVFRNRLTFHVGPLDHDSFVVITQRRPSAASQCQYWMGRNNCKALSADW